MYSEAGDSYCSSCPTGTTSNSDNTDCGKETVFYLFGVGSFIVFQLKMFGFKFHQYKCYDF